MNDVVSVLPATSRRWRPSRAGLVSVWRYWDEEFTFHRGRLLLRGPNGSGKSMALELLLPFLLDADTSPSRLTSAAKSRGGLFDRIMTGTDETTRTGYTWVEFVRGADTFTVGARMRASQSTRKVDVDYFTTTLAVGTELLLLDETRSPLSRKALVEAIGDHGRVHASADEHRAAVREALFQGFSADRYSSVLGALLALRQEKLSQSLNLEKLSDVLSQALPPLDDHEIAAVAEGFERLDRRRTELAALEAEVAEVRQLAARQRDYALAVVVGCADEVRAAETRRDDVTRAEREARGALDSVVAKSSAMAGERGELELRIRAVTIEIEALKDSDAYRQGAALADLRTHARQLRTLAEKTDRFAREQAGARDHAQKELDDVEASWNEAVANLALARRDLRAAAEQVGAEEVLSEAEAIDNPDDGERFVHAWVEAHRAQVRQVRQALVAYGRAVDARTYVEGRVADDEAAVADRSALLDASRHDEAAAVKTYAAAVESWTGQCDTIGATRVGGALPHPANDPAEVGQAVAVLVRDLHTEAAVGRSELAARRLEVEDARRGLVAARDRWAGGVLVEPEGPGWRSSRAGLPGAALWRLVDLSPGVAPDEVDRLEAALTGAGLIDAWVAPDGTVELGDERADVGLGARPIAGRTLADLLVPAVVADTGGDAGGDAGTGVPAQVVAQVLASVPVSATASAFLDGDPEVVIGTDGTFRLGAAIGRGPRRPALLLGAVARERHRLARLAAIDAELAGIDGRLAALERQAADLARHEAAVTAELDSAPSGAAVHDARRRVTEASARLAEAQARLHSTREALVSAESAVREALRDLSALGARHGLPTEAAGLDAIEASLAQLDRAGATWARRRRESMRAERDVARAATRAAEANTAATRAAADRAESDRQASDCEGRVAALESSVGAEYAELSNRIASLDQEGTAGRVRERALAEAMPGLERSVGALTAALAAAEADRAKAEDERSRSHQRFAAVISALGADARVEPPGVLEGSSAVLSAARAIALAHERVDTDPQGIERLSERVRERTYLAQASLGGRVDLSRELAEEGWWVVRTMVGGIRRGANELAGSLSAELAEGREELAAEEERLFEQTLAGSVRRALADRIRLATGLVDAINAQLGKIRTSAGGVEVRLRWEVNPDQMDAVKAARSLLLRDPADLTEAERASLQAFVRARVDQARAELEANAPWEARLRETLDYRSWHRFTLLLGHRDWEGFQPATPRRLQKLSTGERSIALHLPMIASVAAHYAGADGGPSGSPRLILLDELFAGVDTANRAKLFGTFSSWDLDAVLTSDHEWCQYDTLDGIAIHHLHPPTGDEPVTSTRFTWDGHRRRIDPPAA